jgi:hypothetical protein
MTTTTLTTIDAVTDDAVVTDNDDDNDDDNDGDDDDDDDDDNDGDDDDDDTSTASSEDARLIRQKAKEMLQKCDAHAAKSDGKGMVNESRDDEEDDTSSVSVCSRDVLAPTAVEDNADILKRFILDIIKHCTDILKLKLIILDIIKHCTDILKLMNNVAAPRSTSYSSSGGGNNGDGDRGPGGSGGSPLPQNLRDNPERLAKVSTLFFYDNDFISNCIHILFHLTPLHLQIHSTPSAFLG